MTAISIRAEELPALLGFSRQVCIQIRKGDPTFPKARLIAGKHRAWLRSEIEAWAASLPVAE